MLTLECQGPFLVLGLDSPAARASVAVACAAARDADGCDVLVLGCAGMSGLAPALTRELGIPVVDGVAAAVQTVAALVALGLRTSKRDEYAPPPPKPVVGPLARLAMANAEVAAANRSPS